MVGFSLVLFSLRGIWGLIANDRVRVSEIVNVIATEIVTGIVTEIAIKNEDIVIKTKINLGEM
jgi:cytochrome b